MQQQVGRAQIEGKTVPEQRFILTGPPGAGKTSVLQALAPSLRIVPEAARKVIAQQRAANAAKIGDADPSEFLRQMQRCCLADLALAQQSEPAVFDRALPDLVAFAALYDEPAGKLSRLAHQYRFENRVFWFPHWPEIYVSDEDRRATSKQLAEFSEALREAYLGLGYQLVEVPRLPVADRARFILDDINL